MSFSARRDPGRSDMGRADPGREHTERADPEGSDGERSDGELLAAHLAGDHDAFGELFRRHRSRLWAVALRTTGHPEDAADGLQDGMVAAYRRAGTFRGDAAVTTWLHRVVVNACLDRVRSRRVRAADPLPEGVEPGHAVTRALGRDAGREVEDPAGAAVRHEDAARVLDALATLSPEQRAALVLVDMEGWPVAEAAEVLGCATGTVKSRCARGRTRLAVVLADLVAPPIDDTGEGSPSPRREQGTRPGARASHP